MNLSTISRIESYTCPLSLLGGSPVIKSMVKFPRGLVVARSGINTPWGLCLGALLR